MDKIYRKQFRKSEHKNQRIGIPLGIHDKNGNELHSGDTILWNDTECILLWNSYYNEYWAFFTYSKWYGDNIYNADSYGKGYSLVLDDGAKMEITLVR